MLVLLAILAAFGANAAINAYQYVDSQQPDRPQPAPAPTPQIKPSTRPYLGPRRERTPAQRLKRHQAKR